MKTLRKENNYTLIINGLEDSLTATCIKLMIEDDLSCNNIKTRFVESVGAYNNRTYTKIEFDTKQKQKKVIKTLRKRVPECYDLYVRDNEVLAYASL